MKLADRLLKKISASIPNHHYDNFDWEIRSLPYDWRALFAANRAFDFLLSVVGVNGIAWLRNSYYLDHASEFDFLYEALRDEASKDRLVELLAYKVLGYHRVKLSRNAPELWEMRRRVKELRLEERVKVKHGNGYLHLHDLEPIGFDLKLFFTPNGIVIEYLLEQYRYGDLVRVTPGDVVIDCGSCWGDAAIYFASQGAAEVFAYEFIPSNLQVLKRNLALNGLEDRVHVVSNPVWSESGTVVSYKDHGPSSRVGGEDAYPCKVATLSIDDLVEQQVKGPVHFIKMDIEGAEVPALNGAVETIRRFKPKLAVSVYHKPDDMVTIPRLIHEIRDDYRFYLDYYTIAGDEIVLYAV